LRSTIGEANGTRREDVDAARTCDQRREAASTADGAIGIVTRSRSKFAPQPTPETEPFWDGCRDGVLKLQWCLICEAAYFPPSPWCPRCLSPDVEWRIASGRGRLHTYVIAHRPAPGFEEETPYAIAVVELDEGPRLMSNIVGVANTPEHLVLDMELTVTFESRGDNAKVPVFQPAGR
jgi:uncharacterized OB-fold protein